MLSREPLRAALQERNVLAFLAVVRAGEGTSDPDGYRRHFGGRLFTGYADHPRVAITAGGYTSTAAGAYQLLARTWDGLVQQYGFPDFSPASQDEAAVALIIGRGALAAVRAGRLDEAIAACNREWASLPGSPYGQPTRTLAQATRTYLAAGGVIGEPGGVIAQPAPEPAALEEPLAPQIASAAEAQPLPQEAPPVIPAFVAAALPALIEAAPALVRVFGSEKPNAEKAAKAAEAVAAVAMRATGSDTVEGAVRAIQSSPAQAAAYREAVHQDLAELAAAMDRAARLDEASRASAVDRAVQLGRETGGRWLYLLGAVAVAVVLGSYAIVMLVLTREGFSDETRAMLLGQVVILGFGTVVSFLFGSNFSNRVDQAQRGREQHDAE